jgi:hypothetical protein
MTQTYSWHHSESLKVKVCVSGTFPDDPVLRAIPIKAYMNLLSGCGVTTRCAPWFAWSFRLAGHILYYILYVIMFFAICISVVNCYQRESSIRQYPTDLPPLPFPWFCPLRLCGSWYFSLRHQERWKRSLVRNQELEAEVQRWDFLIYYTRHGDSNLRLRLDRYRFFCAQCCIRSGVTLRLII